MKGIFDAYKHQIYVMRPVGKMFIFELVTCIRTHEFTVSKIDSNSLLDTQSLPQSESLRGL